MPDQPSCLQLDLSRFQSCNWSQAGRSPQGGPWWHVASWLVKCSVAQWFATNYCKILPGDLVTAKHFAKMFLTNEVHMPRAVSAFKCVAFPAQSMIIPYYSNAFVPICKVKPPVAVYKTLNPVGHPIPIGFIPFTLMVGSPWSQAS